MIKVTIELISAVTNKISELGVMYIANDGSGGIFKGNYIVAVCRKGSKQVPKELFKEDHPSLPNAARTGIVKEYPRLSYNVWRLIARALNSTFPEESSTRIGKHFNPILSDKIIAGIEKLKKLHSNDEDIKAFLDWLMEGIASE